ncbi:hypothetical protein SG34_025430 [Thalassomonas viridans]|uniref:Uncharacterized protein n=1 Tax=Thalassomonas viridans TaxID=137584 RepID=A0AAF0C8D8_9GAMM|nr:hypothetical protein [Thalassomonas viridans]WDE04633.1 hypothetical protein SG34_025430 [Thalassomonas viridans]
MKVFPRILALYAGDYRRQSYGDIFFWLLFFTAVLVCALIYIARLDFQDVYAAKGQVIRAEQEQKTIRMAIPPSRAEQIESGNAVVVIDNQQQAVTGVIADIKAQQTNGESSLAAYVECSDCRVVLSQEVELHIIIRNTSVFEMFKKSFIKE